MIQTEDLNITGVNPLTAPKFIKAEYPITDKASETVFKFRKQIKDVLDEKDSRQLVIVGPCSIHHACLLYTSPSPRDVEESRMPSSA